jgi:hypothetical protein
MTARREKRSRRCGLVRRFERSSPQSQAAPMEVEAAMIPPCEGVSPQLPPDILSEAHQMPLMRGEPSKDLRAAFKTIRRQGQEQG